MIGYINWLEHFVDDSLLRLDSSRWRRWRLWWRTSIHTTTTTLITTALYRTRLSIINFTCYWWLHITRQRRSRIGRYSYAAFIPDTCSPDTSCIHLSPVAVCIISSIGDKFVVTATCIHLYPRVEHWRLIAYKLLVRDTCIDGTLYLV